MALGYVLHFAPQRCTPLLPSLCSFTCVFLRLSFVYYISSRCFASFRTHPLTCYLTLYFAFLSLSIRLPTLTYAHLRPLLSSQRSFALTSPLYSLLSLLTCFSSLSLSFHVAFFNALRRFVRYVNYFFQRLPLLLTFQSRDLRSFSVTKRLLLSFLIRKFLRLSYVILRTFFSKFNVTLRSVLRFTTHKIA